MANIFTNAKKNETPKAKKNEKLSVKVAGQEFAEKLAQFNSLKAQIEEVKAALEMADGVVRTVGREEYAKLIEKNKTNPESFILTSDRGDKVMFVPTKKYISLDEERAASLKESYGEEIIDEKTTYAFNSEVLERNMDIIADLIQKCTDISEEDKKNLIDARTTYKVKDDTLSKVYTLANESKKAVSEVLDDIQPVCQLKVTK